MKKLLALGLLSVLLLVSGCPDTTSHSQGVYMLLDSSGTYKKEIKRAQAIINYLLGTLQPGDSLAVARIDSASFSEKDIVAKMTFDRRPSMTNQQKRLFKQKVDEFVAKVKGSAYTDITGGVLQAVEYLNETGAGRKHILIFSDLKEELVKGHVRDFPVQVSGCKVVALNVTKLRSDNVDPREYYKRVDQWKERVEAGGGHWRVVNDLERLESILAD
ncbi:MAG: VWA domain-containing protein [Deltaproteobacteria bacterium]|nr:MAG: VWA domain-containing protein [Deltaproteobacteria bacterium]